MLTIRPKIRRLYRPCLGGRELIVGDLGGIHDQVHYSSWGMKLVVEQHKDLDCILELVQDTIEAEDMPRLAVEGMKWVVVDILLKFN